MADDDLTTPTPPNQSDSAQDTPAGGSETASDAPPKKAAKKAPAKKAAAKKSTAKKATAKKAASSKADPAAESADQALLELGDDVAQAKKATAKKSTAKKAATKKSASSKAAAEPDQAGQPESSAPAMSEQATAAPMPLFKAPEPTAGATRRRKPAQGDAAQPDSTQSDSMPASDEDEFAAKPAAKKTAAKKTAAKKTAAKKTGAKKAAATDEGSDDERADDTDDKDSRDEADGDDGGEGGEGGSRRRRRRGGRRRRKSGDGEGADDSDSAASDSGDSADSADSADSGDTGDTEGGDGTSRRRRRRRREGDDSGGGDDTPNTVTRVRKPRNAEDEITAIAGSTRLEAKKQRRREGREAGRRRAPIVSEAEFLARRESVDRVMVIRQREDLTQIGVLEDKVLVEHYVARESQTSLIGNVYLGRVQNVLPSMEAAFIDIGKGRNAVLYAGEVNWSSLGHKEGAPRKIESVLSSGQTILVQVTKDPVGHKGARLTSQVSLAGRFLVYVPDGTTSGISRKLPDTERNRLKSLLKEIVPETAGVIVRTAAEGASEEELTRDVERLKARWDDIEAKTKGQSPKLLYGEPDLTLKVVRDLFTEDFGRLVIQGEEAWNSVTDYVRSVAPDLEGRVEKYDPHNADIFTAFRVDEQIAKALDRKVWLPSGGSLIIDRTEAMTVVDVNTGKFTGSGGNLEETVTKNNLEAAEEVVRQLRLRDIGGIIVVDFIDMVLESNRDLVLRRLVECLGRDRTRHQVAEVTSLGLVQMTRKRIGTGLVEAFSENCPHCQGRGLVLHDMPVEAAKADDEQRRGGGRRRGGRGRGQDDDGPAPLKPTPPSPKDIAAMAKPPQPAEPTDEDESDDAGRAGTADSGPEKSAVAEQPESTEAPEPTEDAPVEIVVTKRTRKPARTRVEKTAQADPPALSDDLAPAPVSNQEQVEAPVTEQQEQAAPLADTDEVPAPVAAPPKVVTRTRRSASRPAGTPVRTTPEPLEPIQVPLQPMGDGALGQDAHDGQGVTSPVEPPKVITRTRGRSASRAAGPPELASDNGVAADGVEPDDAPSSEHSVEHVPIKKKGTRKR